MKGEKFKIALIYLLLLVIVGLIGAMIWLIINSDKTSTSSKEPVPEENQISEKCTFDFTLTEYSYVINRQTSEICGGYNKFNITNVVLNGEHQNISIIYNNGTVDSTDTRTGIYIDDNRIIRHASLNYLNTLSVFDNKLFVLSIGDENSNLVVYNSLGKKVYDLASELKSNEFTDNIFVELAKTNPNLNTTITQDSIDPNGYTFNNNSFNFTTKADVDCTTNQYNGSVYRVDFNKEEFSKPQFIIANACIKTP